MKTKILLFAAILLQTTFLFGQKEQSSFYTTVPENCKQTLKEVINGFNNFKSCSQRAEMNKLLTKSTTVINECPAYFAENQNEFNKAKKYVEDTYERLKCTNTNGNTTQQTNSQNGSSSTNPNVPFFENQYNFEQTSGANQTQAINQLATGITNILAGNKALKEKREAEKEERFRSNNSKNLVSDALLLSFANDIIDEFQKKGFTFIDNTRFELDNSNEYRKHTNSIDLNFKGFNVNVMLDYTNNIMRKMILINPNDKNMFLELKKEKILAKYEDRKIEKGHYVDGGTYYVISIRNAQYSLPASISNKNYITISEKGNYSISNNQPATELTGKQLYDKARDLLSDKEITSENKNIAINYLKKATALGVSDAYEDLYDLAEKEGDYKTALNYINNQIKADAEATYPLLKIGYYFQGGTGVEKNYLEAEKFYKKVLEINSDDISANFKLGQLYEEGGYGITKNIQKAINYYKITCEKFKFKSACQKLELLK